MLERLGVGRARLPVLDAGGGCWVGVGDCGTDCNHRNCTYVLDSPVGIRECVWVAFAVCVVEEVRDRLAV